MRNQDLPLSASFRGLPAVPADQVVTGLIPHEPPNFQTPPALALLSSPVCVVTGQRGVGKTQLAAALARQRVRDGWLVAWVGAETPDQIKAGLVELADRLGLWRHEDSAEITCARVRNHLQTRTGPALLVFDNVVSLDAVRPHLPSTGSTQIVITSTSRGSQVGDEVTVEVFSPETAIQFLRDATGLDDPLAAELAKEVGYLPLALAQAARRIRSARWSYAKYLENFRKFSAEKYLSRRDGDPYPLGAATAVLMALEPFRDSELVVLLSVLSPEGVSLRVLGEADDELVRLHEASLVEFAGDSSVRMHRLVQRVVRDQGRETGRDQDAVARAAIILYHRAQLDGDVWAHRHFCNEIVRQAEAIAANMNADAHAAVVERVLACRLWAANFLTHTSDFVRAGSIAREVHSVATARLGEDHKLPALARQVLAKAMQTESEDMSSLMEKDLAGTREALGPKHRETLLSAVLLSRHHQEHKRPDQAAAVLEQALEPWRDDLEFPEWVLEALCALGYAYTASDRPADAITTLERGLRNTAVAPGGHSRPVLHSMAMLADAYDAVGRHDEALQLLERAWDELRRICGPDHPVALASANRFGLALIKDQQIDRARALFQETHDLADEALGADHETTALARRVLGVLLRA